MNNRVNYAVIGFLVLFGLSLIGGFAYWMLKPTTQKDVKIYAIYFEESVLGLNIDAPVKYRGINVGKVIDLSISEKNSEKVRVLVSILKSTPIKVDTVAKLTAQGITGLTYINLSQGSHLAKPLEAKKGEKYPVIKTVPSFFTNFEKSLGSVSSKLTATLGRTEELLGSDNQEQMSLILRRSAHMMQQMDKLLDDKTVDNLQKSVQHLESISRKVDAVIPNIDKSMNRLVENSINWENNVSESLKSISISYLTIKSSMAEFERSIADGEFNLQEITADLLPTINNSFLEMQEFTAKLKDLLDEYNDSPSDIFYRREEIKKAPGEK